MGAVFPLCFDGISPLSVCLCAQTSPFLRTPVTLMDLIATGCICKDLPTAMSKIRSHSEILEMKALTWEFGGHNSIHNKYPSGQTVVKTREVAGTRAAWPALPGWVLTMASLCHVRFSVLFSCHSSSPSEEGGTILSLFHRGGSKGTERP